MDADSKRTKILKCIASACIGMVIGVVIAEVIANSLIEISLTYVFAIVIQWEITFVLIVTDFWHYLPSSWCCTFLENMEECSRHTKESFLACICSSGMRSVHFGQSISCIFLVLNNFLTSEGFHFGHFQFLFGRELDSYFTSSENPNVSNFTTLKLKRKVLYIGNILIVCFNIFSH